MLTYWLVEREPRNLETTQRKGLLECLDLEFILFPYLGKSIVVPSEVIISKTQSVQQRSVRGEKNTGQFPSGFTNICVFSSAAMGSSEKHHISSQPDYIMIFVGNTRCGVGQCLICNLVMTYKY